MNAPPDQDSQHRYAGIWVETIRMVVSGVLHALEERGYPAPSSTADAAMSELVVDIRHWAQGHGDSMTADATNILQVVVSLQRAIDAELGDYENNDVGDVPFIDREPAVIALRLGRLYAGFQAKLVGSAGGKAGMATRLRKQAAWQNTARPMFSQAACDPEIDSAEKAALDVHLNWPGAKSPSESSLLKFAHQLERNEGVSFRKREL